MKTEQFSYLHDFTAKSVSFKSRMENKARRYTINYIILIFGLGLCKTKLVRNFWIVTLVKNSEMVLINVITCFLKGSSIFKGELSKTGVKVLRVRLKFQLQI